MSFNWSEWERPYQWTPDAIKWLKSRPQPIIDLMLRFPFDAKVVALIDLQVPPPGQVGIIASLFENGDVSVVVPGSDFKAICKTEWLKVIEYRPGATPDDIKGYLKL